MKPLYSPMHVPLCIILSSKRSPSCLRAQVRENWEGITHEKQKVKKEIKQIEKIKQIKPKKTPEIGGQWHMGREKHLRNTVIKRSLSFQESCYQLNS